MRCWIAVSLHLCIYLHTEKAHQLGNLITVSFVKMCFCCMWEYYAHRKSTGAVSLRFFKYNYQKVVSHKESKKSGGKKIFVSSF